MADESNEPGANPRRVQYNAGTRSGIWIGFSGWLFGFLLVGSDLLAVLWGELLAGALLTVTLALLLDRSAAAQPPVREYFGLLLAAIGALLLFCALVVVPAFEAVPELERRLRQLGSVVTLPWWPGAGLIVIGLLLWGRARHASGPRARR